MRLLVLTRQFATGGAERQLITLLRGIDKQRFDVTVVTFYDGGGLAEEVAAIPDIRVVSLGKRGRWDVAGFLWRLRKAVREVRPHVLYGYMGFSHPLAIAFGKACGAKVVWAVRATNMEEGQRDWLHLLSDWVQRRFSGCADLVIANSETGKAHVIRKGYPGARTRVIYNGIDTARFVPSPVARTSLRLQWGIAPDDKVIGLVARLHPMKDHAGFIEAARQLSGRRPDLRFVCVGDDPAGLGAGLRALAQAAGLTDKLIWVPEQRDVTAVYSALDIACSASAYGEGFSNVIAEAMACGTPCVATGVGDSARIMGDLGEVVLPRNPPALTNAIEHLLARLEREGEVLRVQVRMRIEQNFSVDRMVARTEEALAELAQQGSAVRSTAE